MLELTWDLFPAGLAIAEALQLNYIFLCEFEELESPLRDTRSQVRSWLRTCSCMRNQTTACHVTLSATTAAHGALQGGGIHGNAILTKFDITQWAVVEHRRARAQLVSRSDCSPAGS